MITMTDQIIHRIRSYAASQGWRPATLARKAGLSVNALSKVNEPDWSPNTDTLRKIEMIIPSDFETSNSEVEA